MIATCPSAAGVTVMGAVRVVYVFAAEDPAPTARRVMQEDARIEVRLLSSLTTESQTVFVLIQTTCPHV